MPAELIDDRELWDKFIDRSKNGTIFHKWDFLKLQQKYTGYTFLPYGIFHGDTLISVIPLFYNGGHGLKLVYSPPPSSLVNVPYLGFVTGPEMEQLKQREREERWSFIVEQLGREIAKISPNYVTIGLTPGIGDVRPFVWNGYEAVLNYTYMIDLDMPLEKIWESLEKNNKRCIRNAARDPLEIRRVYDAHTFSEAMRNGLKRVGKTFFHRQSPEYLKEVLLAFPDNVRMYFLYNGDNVTGVSVNCGFKDYCILWMGGTAVARDADANGYLQWEMIKRAKEDGYRTLEQCGADEKRLNLAKTRSNPFLMPYFNILKKDPVYRMAKYGATKIENVIGL